MEDNIDRLIKRIDKYGVTFTKPSLETRKISKKTNFIVFNNRHLKESVIIDKKKLKKLLDTDYL